MTLSPSEATFLANFTLADYAQEIATNKKVIASVPDGQGEYCPHEKCMKSLALAWHIASADQFFLNGVINHEFASGGEPGVPANIKTAADIITWYDETIPPLMEKAKGLSGEHLATPVSFFGMFNFPAVVYVTFMSKHAIHHRGQLSAYLRPMGAKVPGIYGPSGDEPMVPAETEPAASAT